MTTTHDIFAHYLVRAAGKQSSVIVGVESAAEASHRVSQMRSEGLTNITVQDRAGHLVSMDDLTQRLFEAFLGRRRSRRRARPKLRIIKR